jgi:hypothetical protein
LSRLIFSRKIKNGLVKDHKKRCEINVFKPSTECSDAADVNVTMNPKDQKIERFFRTVNFEKEGGLL